MARLMSDAEIKRRKRAQGHISQTTGTLGLAALGGTLAASRGGRTALRKIPKLESKIRAPKPLDPDRDKIKGAVTPVLATSAGLGGLGAFNFASYTNAESRKRNMNPVKKDHAPLEMGYYGEEGHPVKLPEIKVPIEKAWSPTAGNFDSERSRGKRNKVYEGGALVGAGAGGAATAGYGLKLAEGAKKLKPQKMAPFGEKGAPMASKATKALPTGELRALKKPAGKLGAAALVTGGSVAAHRSIKRKRQGSWQPYAKGAVSAWGIDHTLDNPDPIQ
jgi:hypothetical protein